jgi:PAS domain S-box-containing protein
MTKRECERIKAVDKFLSIEISKKKELHKISTLAAEVCRTRVAFISFIDNTTQYIKFKFGSDLETIAREHAFCNYTIKQEGIMIVPDARHDERFVNNPLVINNPNIRFYAGIPLTTVDGHRLGSLCVIDQAPKQLDRSQKQMLELLSKQIVGILELDYRLNLLKEQFAGTNDACIGRRFVFENSNASYMLVDKYLKITAFNNEFTDFIEKVYHKDVTGDAGLADCIADPYLSAFIDSCNRALNGTIVQIEQQVKYVNKTLWCRFVFTPVRNHKGEIAGVFFTGEDITGRVELKQKLFKQNRSLEKIAYIHSNELRRLAASITSIMNSFKAENYEATKEELLIMQRAADELDGKIRQIINYTY